MIASAVRLRPGLTKALLLSLVLASFAVRLSYCTERPVNSGDIVRHLVYGVLVIENGLAQADIPLSRIHPALANVAWAGLPYNYPVPALLFFSLIAAIHPTLFFAKLILTLIEAANSWLIYKSSGEKWFAVIYWCSPVSIWWVSREGQFEPLQNLFVFAGIFLLSRRRIEPGLLALAFGVQIKLTAILLLPLFLYKAYREGNGKLLSGSLCFLAGFLPAGIAALSSFDWFRYMPSSYINPYYWNFLHHSIFVWEYPGSLWLRIGNQIASYGLIVALLWGMFRFRTILQHLAPVLFLILCKVHTQVQFWYMILFPSFVLPIEEKKWRLWLFALWPLLDVYSLLQMLCGPFGYVHGYAGPSSMFRLLR